MDVVLTEGGLISKPETGIHTMPAAVSIGDNLTKLSSVAATLLSGKDLSPLEYLQRIAPDGGEPQVQTASSMRALLAEQTFISAEALRDALIRLREQVWLETCLLECNGLLPLEKATRVFTDFAEVAIETAYRFLLEPLLAAHGEPIGQHTQQKSELSIIALGRLGAAELGPACDVDLVFVFEEEGKTSGPASIDNQHFFNQLLAGLFNLLGEDGDGHFALRLYHRKQPLDSGTPTACSLTTLERFVSTRLDEAERATWISARIIQGPQAPLENVIRPFVFRRFLDYTVFATIREQHTALRREISLAGLNQNIRHGPGGLREIEFIIQTFQLIRGGRDSRLRLSSTMAVLDAMVHRRELPTQTALDIGQAYLFLRKLEHRLQYREDKLVHELPTDQPTLRLLAHAMGCASEDEFVCLHHAKRALVEHHFRAVFSEQADEMEDPVLDLWRGELSDEAALKVLKQAGHTTPEVSLAHIQALRQTKHSQHMNRQGRDALDHLIPATIRLCGEHSNASEVLKRVSQVFESLYQRPVYLGLLAQYPSVLERFARFCAASPWVTSYLAQHPILLDELLYPEHLVETMDGETLAKALNKLLDNESNGDQERQMELCCEFRLIHTFRLVAREILLGITPRELGERLATLAESILSVVLKRVWDGMLTKHCEEPLFAVIAYGKHGSRELSYASDLDLVFVYQDDHPDAQEIYARYAKRILNWLNSVTNAGTLFDIDMRLRPDGDSGVLVPSLDSMAEYLRTRAWNWEHQALTRSRFAVGHKEVGACFEAIRHNVLCQSRDQRTLQNEVLDMRHRISEGHPNKGELFQLKHDRGGLVDVEFAVQYLILLHAKQYPRLAEHMDNAALLDSASKLGLVDAAIAKDAAAAYERLRQIQHGLRLQGMETARVEPIMVTRQIAAIRALWNRIFSE